jgi:molybdopterin-binding protein
MKISARNVLRGQVKSVRPGAVNTEVIVELPGGAQVVSIITKESAERLALKLSQEVCAVIKSSDVMIATDED